MEIVKLDYNNPDPQVIKRAAEVLKGDGVIVYPTDTAYGLGGSAYSRAAIQKVYIIKDRSFTKPTHVIVEGWEMITAIAKTNKAIKAVYDKFMPGPLTMILPMRGVIPKYLTGGTHTIGVRIPNCKFTVELSKLVYFPYTTPPANVDGNTIPYSIEEVERQLDIKKVDLIVNAGELPKVPPSTVVDLTSSPAQILRAGPVSKEQLAAVINIS